MNKVWFVFFVIVSCHAADSGYLLQKKLLEGYLRYLQSEIDKTQDPFKQLELQRIANLNTLKRLIARQHVLKRLGKGVKKVFLNGDVC